MEMLIKNTNRKTIYSPPPPSSCGFQPSLLSNHLSSRIDNVAGNGVSKGINTAAWDVMALRENRGSLSCLVNISFEQIWLAMLEACADPGYHTQVWKQQEDGSLGRARHLWGEGERACLGNDSVCVSVTWKTRGHSRRMRIGKCAVLSTLKFFKEKYHVSVIYSADIINVMSIVMTTCLGYSNYIEKILLLTPDFRVSVHGHLVHCSWTCTRWNTMVEELGRKSC